MHRCLMFLRPADSINCIFSLPCAIPPPLHPLSTSKRPWRRTNGLFLDAAQFQYKCTPALQMTGMSSGTSRPRPSLDVSQCSGLLILLLYAALPLRSQENGLSKMKAGVSGLRCDFPSFDAVLFPTEKECAVTVTKVQGTACWIQREVESLLQSHSPVRFSMIIQCVEKQSGREMHEGGHRARYSNHILYTSDPNEHILLFFGSSLAGTACFQSSAGT